MSTLLSAQLLIYKLNSLVDKGEIISVEEMEKLVEDKKIIDFLEDKFEKIRLLNIKEKERELIETELKSHSHLFEISTARNYYGINKNGYLMLSSVLTNLMIEDVI